MSYKNLSGESGAAGTPSANESKEKMSRLLLSGYAAEDDFNADETALF